MTKQTRGFCKYCGKEYTRTGMVKHLAACKEKATIFERAEEKLHYYELVLYGKYDKDYWLIILITENATLEDLDQFIRDIWVECCGHLSAFEIYGERYESIPATDCFWEKPAKSMNCKLKSVFEQGMQIEYEYDYGSTTELIIKVQEHYDAPGQKDKITILSRNNPLQYICSICGKNIATWINPQGLYTGSPFWCEECFEKYENDELELDGKSGFEIECISEIYNSPRMGVCGYEGSRCYPEQFEPDKK